MLNVRRSWHARRKSLKTAPHTGGTSLRQLSRVTISSADSSSVRLALREDDWFKEMGRMKVLKYLWGDKKVKEDEAVKEKYLDPLTKGDKKVECEFQPFIHRKYLNESDS